MIFTIGAVLFVLGYFWYYNSEYSKDWRDFAQFSMMLIGSSMVITSLLILAWKYLP